MAAPNGAMPVNEGFALPDWDELDDAEGSSLDGDVPDESPDLIFLPFQAIKEYPSILNGNTIFIKDKPVEVNVINVERTTHPWFHPNIYEIEIRHGGYFWTIRRRYARIHALRRRLQLHALSMRIVRKRNVAHLMSDLKPRLPRLPKRMEVFVGTEQLENRREAIEKFLQDLLSVSIWREHPETLRFLEVSSLSFLGELGEKGKEMPLKKLSGRIRVPLPCCRYNVFCDVCSRWKGRWILVKDTYYAYMHLKANSSRIANVLLIDRDMKIEHDARYSALHKSVVVRNSTRDLVLKFASQRDLNDWLKYFEYVMSTSASQFIKPHPNGSSFPVRDDVYAKWFIDGAPYMSAVADAIERAQEEIFITDWWLSPEIYMKRPITEGERWRLDRILQRKAEAGVKIYVLLYKEVPIALGINSFYSKATLTKRHPNIKVQRHPDHLGQNVWLWSHHEKTVIIDQKIAFLGGIDLCYGRWDDHLYRLTDVGPVDGDVPTEFTNPPVAGKDAISGVLPMSGMSRPREDAAPEEVELMKKEEERDTRWDDQIKSGKWRMGQRFKAQNASDDADKLRADIPLKEVAAKSAPRPQTLASVVDKILITQPKDRSFSRKDFARRSISMPAETSHSVKATRISSDNLAHGNGYVVNFEANTVKIPSGNVRPESPKLRRRTRMLQNAMRLTRSISHRGDATDSTRAHVAVAEDTNPTEADLDRLNIKVAGRLWLGKDYQNEVRKAFAQDAALNPYDDQIDRNDIPRMPWRDVGCVVYEHAARDVARHFIQRWNACKVEKNRDDEQYTFLLPKSYDTADVDRELLRDSHRCRVQLLRSVCSWSAGLQPNKVEDSIHQAYISCIEKAKHFIYIENQFFITLSGDNRSTVTNGIGEALFQRIKRAFMMKENFRVYVVMPLKPGIEGEYGTDRGAAVQAVTHWNYQSICRGGHSLFERMEELGADPKNYLSFCGMRTYGEINGKLVTELIYVHSKIMVVDDMYTIIGSANINDRSMLGLRDSEVAVLIKDREFDESVMDGKPFPSGKFSGRFRRRLMKICLGIWNEPNADATVADAICDNFFHNVWNATALHNEHIYEDVFACLPSDSVVDFVKLAEWEKKEHICQTDPDEAREHLKKIKGYLCKLALQFLKDQNLTPTYNTRESYLPSYFWT
ncbi:phospholipase D1-like [Paramacrobiotus metropolitanus]|uniref:phospholipase D1-like n=1 Tax=Paramacrobiotus metropolitanus TaxID=2943436 RepID=UPI0024456042|nr:phospholipase D1-like [Paramacrobiotus metropolitanus]XP_055342631.1 phospholipase D1-like [Paramacrobiotus metropolitanus]XP_055342638.1 phospholipase D1-like [Paramacrobiotus metropolitanus]XP_055342646.1 phospholipase D1-like [Paramacrobiotus metropolitanus]XP_055342653.1 phospholipase D1-like [Paramacrobiotus metropolitanus]